MMIMRMKMRMRIIVKLMMMKTIMKGIQVVAKKTAFQAAREVILAMEKISLQNSKWSLILSLR